MRNLCIIITIHIINNMTIYIKSIDMPLLRATCAHKTKAPPWPLHSTILHLVEKAETVQVHLTLEGEGLRTQRNDHGWTVYMHSYMANRKYRFKVCRNLHQVHLQEVSLMQTPLDHVNDTAFECESKAVTITDGRRPLACRWINWS